MAPRRAPGRLSPPAPRPLRGPSSRSRGPGAVGAFVLVALGLGAVVGGASLLSGCGKGKGGGADDGGGAGGRAAGRDRSTPDAVLVGVADALARGDLETLDAYLTPDARAAVRRDLEAFRAALRDPAVGPRYASRLPEPRGDAEGEVYRRAIVDGDAAALLHLLARAAPRPPPAPLVSPGAGPAGPAAPPPAPPSPSAPGAGAPGGAMPRLERDLPAGDGTRRRVVLVSDGAAWYVDRLQL